MRRAILSRSIPVTFKTSDEQERQLRQSESGKTLHAIPDSNSVTNGRAVEVVRQFEITGGASRRTPSIQRL